MEMLNDNNNSNTIKNETSIPIELNVVVNNMTAIFNVGCQVDVEKVASKCENCKLSTGAWWGAIVKFREPRATLLVRNSGKMNCVGVQSAEDAEFTAIKFVRILRRMSIPASLNNLKIINVQSTCLLPWGLKFDDFINKNKPLVRYEPERKSSASYEAKDLKSHVNIYASGFINIVAPSLEASRETIIKLFPLLYDFQCDNILNSTAN